MNTRPRNLLRRVFLLLGLACALATSSVHAAAESAPTEPLPITTFKRLQAGDKQTVVVYGTSLTAICEWPNEARKYFENHFPGQVTFVNSAKSGMHSNWGVENLAARVLTQNPDLVFIEFSANDAATKHGISLETSRNNLNAMVKAIRQQNPRVDIVIQTMNPAWDSPTEASKKTYGSDRPRLADYYGVYRHYAREQGLPLLDHYPTWHRLQQQEPQKFERWIPDGIHPNAEGSLAVTWPAVEALLEKARAAAAN